MLFHGAIVSTCGDTPASNFVGGFKEGVGFALRKRRMCMATTDEISTKVHALHSVQVMSVVLYFIVDRKESCEVL